MLKVEELDGGGRALIPYFFRMLNGRTFDKCFEWCAGPGYIGRMLHANAVCDDLVMADINPAAVDYCTRMAAGTGARTYLSDNMRDIPEGGFDLVVANPPNYCNIQASHPMGHLRDDPRPSDPGWKVHREFYSQIADFITDDAEMWINEIEPFSREVILDDAVYDRRENLPISDFDEMIRAGGLKLARVFPYYLGGLQCAFLKVTK